jgi:hypothetical protein
MTLSLPERAIIDARAISGPANGILETVGKPRFPLGNPRRTSRPAYIYWLIIPARPGHNV